MKHFAGGDAIGLHGKDGEVFGRFGGGNILQVLTAIRNLKHLGVVDVELTRADLGQEPIKVLTNKVSYEQDDSDDGDDFGTDACEELPDDTEHELADFYGNPYGRPE